MKKYNTTPAQQITGTPKFDEVFRAYEIGKEESRRQERTTISLIFFTLFITYHFITLSDIQKSLIIDKVFYVGQSIESFFLFIVTL